MFTLRVSYMNNNVKVRSYYRFCSAVHMGQWIIDNHPTFIVEAVEHGDTHREFRCVQCRKMYGQ